MTAGPAGTFTAATRSHRASSTLRRVMGDAIHQPWENDMERRDFLALAAAVAASPAVSAAGAAHVPYSASAYAAALASGKPLLLDFYAPW